VVLPPARPRRPPSPARPANGALTRLPGRWLTELDYKALAGDPEAQIRRLLAACGLKLEAACRRPERAPGAMATASSAQVRSPISKAWVDAWKRDERQLQPLRAALEA
jgi:hypothetical protein